eukprot:3219135-Pleurochrysis_carterae.AAC.1
MSRQVLLDRGGGSHVRATPAMALKRAAPGSADPPSGRRCLRQAQLAQVGGGSLRQARTGARHRLIDLAACLHEANGVHLSSESSRYVGWFI